MQFNIQLHPVPSAGRGIMAIAAAMAMCLALAFPAAGNAADEARPKAAAHKMVKKEKVVFQVSEADPKSWNLALNNVKNVQEALGKDNVVAEIVAYGPGIGMLKVESTVGNRVNDAVAAGVKVVACENTMHAQKLSKDDMLAGISYVPAGVIELMQKQRQGYAYIRP